VIAFIFPGQNSHSVGMGRDLYDNSEVARGVLDAANLAAGGDLLATMFDGPEDALTATENQQPAIVAHSLAALQLVQEAGIAPDFVAGHSLGEYSALAAAGALGPEETVRLVRYRGEIMARADELAPGTMSAVLGLDDDQVEAVVAEAGQEGVCVVANFNCPGQVVMSGTVEAIERAEAIAREAGAKRVMRLQVSGAFHSPLMQPAAEMLTERLAQVDLQPAIAPIVANVDATGHTDPSEVRDALGQQMTHSVLWKQCVESMVAQGVDTFIEIGPGTVLAKLMRRISRDVDVHGVADMATFAQTIEALN